MEKVSFALREITRLYQQIRLCQEGVVFPLSPTNNLHRHSGPTTPVRHSIPTLEGKRVYQILHVLRSYIKLNVNQSLVCLSKWLSLPLADMTAWCWTQIRHATKIMFTSCVDWEAHGRSRSVYDERLLSWGTHTNHYASVAADWYVRWTNLSADTGRSQMYLYWRICCPIYSEDNAEMMLGVMGYMFTSVCCFFSNILCMIIKFRVKVYSTEQKQ